LGVSRLVGASADWALHHVEVKFADVHLLIIALGVHRGGAALANAVATISKLVLGDGIQIVVANGARFFNFSHFIISVRIGLLEIAVITLG